MKVTLNKIKNPWPILIQVPQTLHVGKINWTKT